MQIESINKLKQQLAESLAESKANPVTPYFKWESWPHGNMENRRTRSAESRRRSQRRSIRRKIRKLQAEQNKGRAQTVRFDEHTQITFRNNKPISSTQYFDEASGTYKWR
jgi:hypothetical protein